MADEIEVVEGLEQSGQELEGTTNLGTEQEVEGSVEEQEEQEVKTFTQEELEAEIGKRLARERRKIEREQRAAQEVVEAPLQIDSKLDPNQFKTTEEYLDALATEKAEAIITHREQSRSVNAINEKYQDQVDAALDKYPDYIQVAHSHKFMTNEMAEAIKASDIAVDLAYHLGTNLKEAERIFKLPPILQIKELGKLEARLEAQPPEVKKVSSAPPPISPIQGSKTTSTTYDTTDPRSTKSMTATEWIAADRARRLKAAQG